MNSIRYTKAKKILNSGRILCVRSKINGYEYTGRFEKRGDDIFLLKKSKICPEKKLKTSLSEKVLNYRENLVKQGFLFNKNEEYDVIMTDIRVKNEHFFGMLCKMIVGESLNTFDFSTEHLPWTGIITDGIITKNITLNPWWSKKKYIKIMQRNFNRQIYEIPFAAQKCLYTGTIINKFTYYPAGCVNSAINTFQKHSSRKYVYKTPNTNIKNKQFSKILFSDTRTFNEYFCDCWNSIKMHFI